MTMKSSQRGATIVEAAVTSLVLFMLLLAVIDFGRAFNMYQVMTDAAREGARYAVAPLPGNPPAYPGPSQVASYVCNYLQSGHVQPDTSATCGLSSGAGPACSTWPGSSLPTSVGPGVYVLQGCPETVNGIATSYTEVDIKAPFKFWMLPFTVNMTTRAAMRNETGD